MKNIILHMGGPKTGSSALQAYLDENRESLNEQNIDFPVPNQMYYGEQFKNSGGNANYVFQANVHMNEPLQIDIIRDALKTYDTIIISGELLFVRPEYKNLFEKLRELDDCKICVIVYLREQSEYIESIINQQVKMGNLSKIKYPECMDSELLSLFNYFEYDKKIEEIEKYADEVIVRPYDRKDFKNGNIFDDFMSLLGVDNSSFRDVTIDVNPSLTSNYLEIKRVINELPDVLAIKELYFDSIMELSDMENKENGKISPKILSDDDINAIRNRYLEGNTKIAQKYLQRDYIWNASSLADNEKKKKVETDINSVIKIFAMTECKVHNSLKNLYSMNEMLETRVNSNLRMIDEIRQQNEEIKECINRKNLEIQDLIISQNCIKNSISYKIGRIITYIPRKIRDLFRK